MTPQTVPKQAFGFFVEEMEGENLLYRLGGHKAIHLNDTATVIWKLCDGSRNSAGHHRSADEGVSGLRDRRCRRRAGGN